MLDTQVSNLLEALRETQKTSSNKCQNFFNIVRTINMVLGVLREVLFRIAELEKVTESLKNQSRFVDLTTGEIKN